jgi:hypothetical protein
MFLDSILVSIQAFSAQINIFYRIIGKNRFFLNDFCKNMDWAQRSGRQVLDDLPVKIAATAVY